MTSTPIAAGYIVTDNELIHGYGPTADAAWADMERTMEMAQIRLVPDDEDTDDLDGSWTRTSNLTIRAASAALLADVEAKGGAIGWRDMGGVACTRAEYEGE